MATGITIDEVTNTLDDIQGTEKIPVSSGVSEPEVVTTGDLKDYINGGMQEEISDLSTIRSGASAGATAYQKPSSGIPSTDLASAVQTSLGKADTALQSFTETDPTVPSWAKQSSKPSYAVGEISGAQETLVSGTNIKTINNTSVLGSGNISIQGGDTNVIESISFNGSSVPVDSNKNAAITYTAPVTSVNGNTGAVSLSIPTESTVSGWGFTKNAGTITGVTMNGASKGTSGVVDLGTVITAHQDISGKADKSEMSVSASGDQTTITLKSGTSATVINQHQSLSGYVQTSNTAGLIKNDGTIDTTSYGTYSKPSGGIPASDIASGVIPTVPSNIVTGSSQSYTIWSGTQAQYDALATKDSSTIYLIKES